MVIRFIPWLFFLFPVSILAQSTDVIDMESMEWRFGEGPWQKLEGTEWWTTHYEGQLEMRGEIHITQELEAPILVVSILASYEVWWDGQRIGRNGIPGQTVDEEEEGGYLAALPLSVEQASPGVHQIELRASNWNSGGKLRFYTVLVAEMHDFFPLKWPETLFFMSFVGFFAAVSLLFLLFFVLVERRETYAVFAALCFCVSVLLTFEYMKYFWYYPYGFHFSRLRIIAALTALSGLLLIRFFMARFENKGKWTLPAAVVWMTAAFILLPGYDDKSFMMMAAALGFCSPIVFRATRKREKGSLMAAAGLGLCAIPALAASRYMDGWFFLGFMGLILILLVELAIHARDQRRRLVQTRLQSTILKQELLKKHIQPHFLLNTLTSVIEWIEEHPRTGVRMIEALANEFRILNRIVDKSLIPVSEELALCHAHLEVMGHTLNRKLEMETHHLDPGQKIPPGLFHTSLENALTHGDPQHKGPIFTIKRELQKNETCFIISNPISSEREINEGAGLAYVRARLEEAFQGRWRLKMGPVDDQWRLTIIIEEVS